ncbi:T7SS effector LXG polymorphic toxin [Streptococcus ferus]|uniref:Membrane protein n=1 Tax=Streptococcus ferus TaxID=1345 RepID=A0A2X3W8A0_9STRE|nr:T7SS effector LXG polymorphic toxin [Streptococcus ferus]SQF40556.1 membrane protein [Streptococcus ferus]
MVKMVLGSSDSQATSVATLADNYTAGFESLISAFDNLANEDKLSGDAYTNIKSYGSSVVTPLVKAFILLADAAKADVQKLPDEYRAQVGGEDLDEETLTAQISAYATTIEANQTSVTSLGKTEPMTDAVQTSINNLNDAITSDTTAKTELEEKLRKLREYDAQSSGFFSDIAALESAVTTGLSQLQAGVTSFNGTFTLPSQKDLEWTKTINSQWEEREVYLEAVEKGKKGEELNDEDVKAIEAYQKRHPNVKIDQTVEAAKDVYTVDKNYQDVVKKIDNGEVLTEADVVAINAYAKFHPDVKPSKQIVNALDEYYYGFDDIPETLISKAANPKEWGKEWSWATIGKMLDDANEVAIKQGKNLGRVLGAKLQPRDALGRFVKDTIKPRAWLSGKLKGMSNGTSKLIGHSAKFLGFGVSAALEGFDHYSKHKNVGRAISYGAVGGAVALGAGAVAGAIGTAAALPAIGTLAVGIAVGAVASAGLKAAYENIKPVKDVIDGAGDLLNKGGKAVSDGVKSIGKAFSNPIGSLKGAFGW